MLDKGSDKADNETTDQCSECGGDLKEPVRRARFSSCQNYRYLLERRWRARTRREHSATFIGLNPSTGDGTQDDPTVRRCMGFARAWGCERVFVTNLFAWRTPFPSALREVDEPVGEDNAVAIAEAVRRSRLIVVCWGRHGRWCQRDEAVLASLRRRLWCFGINADGTPVHPLYQPLKQPLQPYPIPTRRVGTLPGTP